MDTAANRKQRNNPAAVEPSGTKRRVLYRGAERADAPLIIVTLLLLAFGLIMMYSASYARAHYMFGDGLLYIRSQAIYAVIGLAAMFIVSRINYRILHQFTWIITVGSVLLLLITLFMPPLNGARRWIFVGPSANPYFTIQPSEISKFAMILFVSHISSVAPRRMREPKYGFLQPMAVLGATILIMSQQTHLSGAIIIGVLTVTLMFIGGTRWQWFGITVAAAVPLGAVYIFAADKLTYAQERINNWLRPLENISSGNHQTFQSLLAIGSGGLMGLGLGNSRQKHLFLPESHNDFIFAVICEELGFIGAVFVIALFVFFVFRGFSVALRAKDRFGAMLAIGITLQIGLQALLNIAVVTNSIPNTGISLPFFSQGGTSLMILLAEVGVLLSVSRFSNVQTARELRKARQGGTQKSGANR